MSGNKKSNKSGCSGKNLNKMNGIGRNKKNGIAIAKKRIIEIIAWIIINRFNWLSEIICIAWTIKASERSANSQNKNAVRYSAHNGRRKINYSVYVYEKLSSENNKKRNDERYKKKPPATAIRQLIENAFELKWPIEICLHAYWFCHAHTVCTLHNVMHD